MGEICLGEKRERDHCFALGLKRDFKNICASLFGQSLALLNKKRVLIIKSFLDGPRANVGILRIRASKKKFNVVNDLHLVLVPCPNPPS